MKTNKFITKLMACLLTLNLSSHGIANTITPTNSLCTASGYTIGFFNGVFNSLDEAQAGTAAIWKMRGGVVGGDTFKNEPVQYETFYNHSGKNNDSGATRFQDVAEVFIQRANELDRSGNLAKHKEMLWEIIEGKGTFTNKMIAIFPAYENWKTQLQDEIKTKYIASLASNTSNPPTEADYSKHNARLDALNLQKQKLMLVAHSQGNLFMNKAYEYIKPKIGSSSVQVVHIAPASTILYGEHWLAAIDVVINGLRLTGNVPEVSPDLDIVSFPPQLLEDFSGHELIKTYLNRPLSRSLINASIVKSMSELITPATGNIGSFTVTLTWNGTGDVDLHTFEPNGFHSYYSNRQGPVGFLDVDNTYADGPERYFASCDPTVLQVGSYKIAINNYARATGRMATIQIATPKDGVIFNKVVGVGSVRGSAGDSNPIQVVTVNVTKDTTTGKFKFNVL